MIPQKTHKFSPLEHFFLGLCLLSLFACLSACSTLKHPEKWKTIFNGKDLKDWRVKITGHALGINYKNTFQVKDGILAVSYDAYEQFDDKFGHLLYKKKLSHFKLRLEYRFIGEQVQGAPDWAFKNSGIKFHAQPPKKIPIDQKLLVAIETQLLGGNGQDERPTANVCTAGTHIEMNGELITQHCTNSSSATFHDEQWVRVELEVRGNNKVIHWVNGQKVLEYEKPQLDDSDPFAKQLLDEGHPRMLHEGYIALQAESHPVEFRNIQLLKLKK
ncbi:MAG: DUF1080 domain-containing protein [Microscillaceae bacterium]|nr:DUF1080 domain-containing protein [Microscillaceae bacterium]